MNRYVTVLVAVLMANAFAQTGSATTQQTPTSTNLPAARQISGNKPSKDIIPGKWSFRQAKRIVLAKLREAQKRPDKPLCRTDACNIHHEVLRQFPLHYRNRESVILIADSPDPAISGHSDVPALSLF